MKIICACIALGLLTLPVRAEYIAVRQVPKEAAATTIQGVVVSPGMIILESIGGIKPPGPAPVLGQGYDMIKDELRSDCLKANGHDHHTGVKGASQDDIEYINTTSDLESYQRTAKQSFNLSASYKLFNAKLESDTFSETSSNSVDQYARLYRYILIGVDSRNDGAWEDSVDSIVKKGLDDPAILKRFTERCGTHYVSAIYHGDVVDQTLHFKLNKSSYTDAGKLDFSAGLKGIFSAGYSDTTSQTKLSAVSTYVATKGDEGLIGKSIPDPNKPGGILDAARFVHTSFSDQVAAADVDQTGIIGIEVQPYWLSSAPGTDTLSRWQDEAFQRFQNKQGLYLRLLSAIGDLNFALGLQAGQNPPVREVFYAETDDDLKSKLKLAQAYQTAFRNAVNKCYDSATKGDEPATKMDCGTALDNAITSEQIESTKPKLK